ncbi:MAG: response regulator receiver domain [Rhodobacteraceae bacterium]|nr:response regulator receiver domain [Paracoccaceae bacterium]
MSTKEDYCIPNYVKRFLQTAVIVDDQAYNNISTEESCQPSVLIPPTRGKVTKNIPKSDNDEFTRTHSLNAVPIIKSFLKNGIICGVMEPDDNLLKSLKKADIVVLDWLLKDKNPSYTIDLLRRLVSENENGNSLRLIAIYTGESRIDDIQDRIYYEVLSKANLNPKNTKKLPEITYKHGRLVIYAKSKTSVSPSLENRIKSVEDLPLQLIIDYSSMTEGLLPGIALTSLAAVRENAHNVLDRFNNELDPAYLTQRSLISNPEESEQQMVDLIAEELRGNMGDAVFETKPAGSQEVNKWLDHKEQYKFGNKTLGREETIKFVNKGNIELENWKGKNFHKITSGFVRDENSDGSQLDKELAWITSFRALNDKQPRKLVQGTVISVNNSEYLICIRPSCDCVRLKKKESFCFLKLNKNPTKESKLEYVKAELKNNQYYFTDINKNDFKWVGELKTIFTQRIIQKIATDVSRLGVDDSEWLRRQSKKYFP